MCGEVFKVINVMQTHQIVWSIDNVTSPCTHAIEDLCLETMVDIILIQRAQVYS